MTRHVQNEKTREEHPTGESLGFRQRQAVRRLLAETKDLPAGHDPSGFSITEVDRIIYQTGCGDSV